MPSIFENLAFAEGSVNPSGIKSIGYWVPKSWIKTFPSFNQAPATAKDNVTLTGDFELIAGKTWLTIYTTQGKGKVTFEPSGEKDCKIFLNKGTLHYPDINDAGKSLAKNSLNSNVVFIIPLPHETEKRFVILGDPNYDVTTTMKGDSGDAPGSAKGITVEIEAPSTTPLPNYHGKILLDNGTIDCETGVFTPTAP